MSLIAVVGGECTGKSTLAAALGAALSAPVVPEELRRFVQRQGRVPGPAEQAQVLAAQVAAEEEALAATAAEGRAGAGWVVSDGAALTTAVYSLLYYRDDGLVAPALARMRRCALVVWCAPDPAWVADPGMRDGPAARAAADAELGRLIRANAVPALRVSGSTDVRVGRVLAALTPRSRPGVPPRG